MAFFSEKKLKRINIEVESDTAKCDSPEVMKRLERIDANYDKLNAILANLELKFEDDSRFAKWLNESGDEATNLDGDDVDGLAKPKKRKKRASRAKKSKPASQKDWRPTKPR